MTRRDPAVDAWHRIFRDRALRAIDAERDAQIDKWGHQTRRDGTDPSFVTSANLFRNACDAAERTQPEGASWRAILLEEVYEALCETDPALLRKELVQSGAVIAAWIENIDQREALSGDAGTG